MTDRYNPATYIRDLYFALEYMRSGPTNEAFILMRMVDDGAWRDTLDEMWEKHSGM